MTHLVTKTSKLIATLFVVCRAKFGFFVSGNIHGSELCERTMKFFQSMARRIWIISHHWVNRCLEADKLLPVVSVQFS